MNSAGKTLQKMMQDQKPSSHLKKVGASYTKHFLYATWFNMVALAIFVTGTIHSVLPFVFANTPYKLAKYIVTNAEKEFNLDD
jgi:hypothetical protein